MQLIFCRILVALLCVSAYCSGQNQTATITPIQSPDSLPFTVSIEQAGFQLPNGWHSGIFGVHKGKWVLLAGRTNGLHGFDNNNTNFPPSSQNQEVYVIDPALGKVWNRSLTDPSAKLSQAEIDSLSVTSPQFFQSGKTVYMCGGYGVDSTTGNFSTKPLLSAIDLPDLIRWVQAKNPKYSLKNAIRQTSHPILQVTGGEMFAVDKNLNTLLIFGQNFKGFYVPGSNGEYTNQVRRFRIRDTGKNLSIIVKTAEDPNENYRRRDLNIVPVIQKTQHGYRKTFVALSGVFTETDGAWTVPVTIYRSGRTEMPDPNLDETFKQGMNNYASAAFGLFSTRSNSMYEILMGGISFGYFQGGLFQTDDELPFINQVTTIRIDEEGRYSQHLMEGEYPVILSTQSNPGNPLLFGAGAIFILDESVKTFNNGVISLDKIKDYPALVGYIVGGIQSTLPNTNTNSDSAPSPYIFKVILGKRN